MISDKITILIVDDHPLIVDGIKAMLDSTKEFKIIGDANDGNEAILKAKQLKPDVIFMDISLPGLSGIETTKLILQSLPDTKIIALTQHEDKEYIQQMKNAGTLGYLLKNSKKSEFIEAIIAVSKGENYYSRKIADLLLNNFFSNGKITGNDEKLNVRLTNRETEIVRMIAEEKSNQEIADELNISLRTVETHRKNLMQKLNIKSVVSLVKYAASKNIIKL